MTYMDLSQIKNVSPNRHLAKKIVSLLVSIIVMVVSFIVISEANKEASDTVEVLRVKSDTGLQAFEPITEEHIEVYRIIRKEYTEDMVLASEKQDVLDKMVKYYIRPKSVLYKDQLTDQKPLRNEWLYELEDEFEVLTIPYNYLECGGDVLLPGDKVRIRVTYEVEDDQVDPYQTEDYNPNLNVVKTPGKKVVTDILFDSIVVKDMLNANSHSIYEIYKEVMNLNEAERQKVLKSEEFLRSIQPKALLLAGTKEQVDKYARFNGTNTKSILITILSRANSEVILDHLPSLISEVESWIEKKDQ